MQFNSNGCRHAPGTPFAARAHGWGLVFQAEKNEMGKGRVGTDVRLTSESRNMVRASEKVDKVE